MVKATFRLPQWELRRLREQSERQRRALNSVVIDVIARGLGEHADEHELLHALGSMVARPSLTSWSASEMVDEDERPQLTDALDWTRGDR